MSESAEQRIAELEETVERLNRELIGIQEMLAFVLNEIGEDVFVSHESLSKGLPDGTQIKVEDDRLKNGFIFGLVNSDG